MRRLLPLSLPLLALAAGCGTPSAGDTTTVAIVSVSPVVCTRDASATSTWDCTTVTVVVVAGAPTNARLHVALESDLLGSVSLDGWTALPDASASVDVSVQHVAVSSCMAGEGLAQRVSAGIDDGSGNENPQDVRWNVPISVSCQ